MRSPDTTFVIELLSPSTVPSGVQRVLLFIYTFNALLYFNVMYSVYKSGVGEPNRSIIHLTRSTIIYRYIIL